MHKVIHMHFLAYAKHMNGCRTTNVCPMQGKCNKITHMLLVASNNKTTSSLEEDEKLSPKSKGWWLCNWHFPCHCHHHRRLLLQAQPLRGNTTLMHPLWVAQGSTHHVLAWTVHLVKGSQSSSLSWHGR